MALVVAETDARAIWHRWRQVSPFSRHAILFCAALLVAFLSFASTFGALTPMVAARAIELALQLIDLVLLLVEKGLLLAALLFQVW